MKEVKTTFKYESIIRNDLNIPLNIVGLTYFVYNPNEFVIYSLDKTTKGVLSKKTWKIKDIRENTRIRKVNFLNLLNSKK